MWLDKAVVVMLMLLGGFMIGILALLGWVWVVLWHYDHRKTP